MNNTPNKNLVERGIKLNINFKQFIVVSFMLMAFVILPITWMEKGTQIQAFFTNEENINPYSQQNSTQDQGDVAGISTQANSPGSNFTIPLINQDINLKNTTDQNLPILIAGVVLISISLFILIYMLLGLFEQN